MVLIGKSSNKPTAGMMNPLQGAPGPIYRDEHGSNLRRPGHLLLAAWWDPVRDRQRPPRELWAVPAVFKETEPERVLHRVAARGVRRSRSAPPVRDRTGTVGTRGAGRVQPGAARVPRGARRLRCPSDTRCSSRCSGCPVRGSGVTAVGRRDQSTVAADRALGRARDRRRVARGAGRGGAAVRTEVDAPAPRRAQTRRPVAVLAHERSGRNCRSATAGRSGTRGALLYRTSWNPTPHRGIRTSS